MRPSNGWSRRASFDRKMAPAQVPQMACVLPKCTQRFQQAKVHRQFANGGGFASGHDQAVQPGELSGQAYFGSLHAQTGEHEDVFGKIALDG